MKDRLPIVLIVGVAILLAVFLIAWSYLPGGLIFRQPKISVRSDVSGYTLTLARPSKFAGYLKEFGFWQPNAIYLRGEEKRVTAEELVVHLVAEEQPLDHVAREELIQAVGERNEDGTLHLLCYISPEILEGENETFLSQRIDGQVLHYTFYATHFQPTAEAAEEIELTEDPVRIDEIMNELDKQGRLFRLKKD